MIVCTNLPGKLLTSFITGIQFKHSFLVCWAEHLSSQAQDACCLPDPGHARNDDMGHISIFCNYLQALNRFSITNNIVKVDRAVFLDPKVVSAILKQELACLEKPTDLVENSTMKKMDGWGARWHGKGGLLYQGSS